jgi:PhnB protein
MKLNPHISFGGQCEAAFSFYEKCLEGKIETMLTWGKSPMAKDVPLEWHDKICHATLTVGANVLAGADVPAEQYERPSGFQILLGMDDPEDAERIFHALAINGTVKMPIQQTFWSARFGVLIDQFGVPWEINCEQPTKEVACQ